MTGPLEGVRLSVDERPGDAALRELWRDAWGAPGRGDWGPVLERSLCFVCAWERCEGGERLVGFVNVAWDGGIHASIFDTCVRRELRRRGIATALVRRAADEARARGAEWLHVDFEPHLEPFYRRCGFRPTAAGLMRLDSDDTSRHQG